MPSTTPLGLYGVNDLTPAEVTTMVGEGPLKLIQDVLTERNLVADAEAACDEFPGLLYSPIPRTKQCSTPAQERCLKRLKT